VRLKAFPWSIFLLRFWAFLDKGNLKTRGFFNHEVVRLKQFQVKQSTVRRLVYFIFLPPLTALLEAPFLF
jgi:hypothetical protein